MGPKFFWELSIEHKYKICLDYQIEYPFRFSREGLFDFNVITFDFNHVELSHGRIDWGYMQFLIFGSSLDKEETFFNKQL